ncbi:MAG: prolipoprotein diacylglyceryl transferase [Xanthomonadaceae bacterium]|jgi:phosphatidylglycerol:prolipoprotein diacylglycerol transferase|nr:prolipoprotein diacylglyceryl transferase [Xanthomonadaceae bacterium]
MIYLHQIDPIALSLPKFSVFGMTFHPQVHWYGIMYLLGFAAAWWLGRSRIRAGRLPGIDMNGFSDLLFYGMLGAVVGGRVGYMLIYMPHEFLQDPMTLFRVWDGGMSFHGGLIGVLLASGWWAYRHRLHFFDTVDFAAPLIPPGLGFGRLGNFIGGELWGKPTGSDWGVIFPGDPAFNGWSIERLQAEYATGALDHFARHPSQLYQALLEGLTMFCLLWWFSRKPRPRYAVSGMFALLYGLFRFAVEFVRVPDAQLGYLAFDWLTMGQVLSMPLILLGLLLLWLSRRAPTLQPAAPAETSVEGKA